jgi:hypothetical protein
MLLATSRRPQPAPSAGVTEAEGRSWASQLVDYRATGTDGPSQKLELDVSFPPAVPKTDKLAHNALRATLYALQHHMAAQGMLLLAPASRPVQMARNRRPSSHTRRALLPRISGQAPS